MHSRSSSDDEMDKLERKVMKKDVIQQQERPQRPVSVVSSEVASALDRTQVSDRNAAFLVAATAKSLDEDVSSSIAVSRSTIRRARIANWTEFFC